MVVARLDDGTWSAPSAIATAGGGFGGQIGLELTDFVFILNDAAAVRSFSQVGSLTFGGNVSIAAGPIGRNAEAAGAASLKGVAAVFSYSKTKGLFAGVSLEGSGFMERKDANEKLYNSRITAAQILGGGVRPPPAAEPLMRVLNSRVFAGVPSHGGDNIYNDIPVYDHRHDDVAWEGRRDRGASNVNRDSSYSDQPKRSSTWADNVYDRQPGSGGINRSFSTRANPEATFDTMDGRNRSSSGAANDDSVYSDRKPIRPTAPKPNWLKANTATAEKDQALALFTFKADQPDDLEFNKGDVITITKKTENATDWWTGRIGERTGIFPRYVTSTP